MTPSRRLVVIAAAGLALALAAAIAAIAGFGAWVREREVEGDVRRGGLVAPLEPGAARRILVEAGGARAELVRGPEGWRSAAGGAAGSAEAAALLGRLGTLQRRGTSGSERGRQEARAYGLDAPRARIAVTLAGGVELRLAIGATTGTDGTTFVRGPDGTVAIVAADAGEGLLRAAGEVLRAGSAAPPPPPAAP